MTKSDDVVGRQGPLHGVRILDLTTVIMGPAATQILGDLGADVIKVEQPAGDSMRNIGPFRHDGMGPMYLQANRNKRSVMLNLKDAADRATLLELASGVDVVVTNVRPQAMQRLGLDGAPKYAPINICDRVVGLYLVTAITSALHHRQATGEGQEIEVPMFETMAQFVLADHMGGGAFVPPIGKMGYKRLLSSVRGPYATRDGHLSLVVYTDKHWRAFSDMVGLPGLLDNDPRFCNQEARTQHAEDMGRFIEAQLPRFSNAEWIAKLEAADIPVSPVNSIEDLFTDPHLNAVGLFSDMAHPTEGVLKVARFPVKFSRSPATIRRLAPTKGADTEAVIAESRARAARAGG